MGTPPRVERPSRMLRMGGASVFGAILLMFAFGLVANPPVFAANSLPPAFLIENAEARLSPVLIGVASVFMKISNSSGQPDKLTGARADLPRTVVLLHATRDGRMVKVDDIDIAPGKTVDLTPGGLHIMVLGLPRELQGGNTLSLTLVFARAGEVRLTVPVR